MRRAKTQSSVQRRVLPEHLDSLPHADPAALRSRRELLLINRIMGNAGWFVRELERAVPGGERVLELGAGDGSLLRAARAPGGPAARKWQALDLLPAPADWPPEAAWIQTDLFALSALPETEVLVANLFLHHFEKDQLRWIGDRVPACCRLILASEPARYAAHSLQGRVLSWVAGFGPVTRHDMQCSIEAGFRGMELPEWLGLSGWQVRVKSTLLGAYRMRAWR